MNSTPASSNARRTTSPVGLLGELLSDPFPVAELLIADSDNHLGGGLSIRPDPGRSLPDHSSNFSVRRVWLGGTPGTRLRVLIQGRRVQHPAGGLVGFVSPPQQFSGSSLETVLLTLQCG
jgi:hypothetical protein